VVNGEPFEDEDDDFERITPRGDMDDDDWQDSIRAFEARLETRMDSGYAPFLTVVENNKGVSKARQAKGKARSSHKQAVKAPPAHRGLKKLTPRQIAQDLPPTPRGCEWRRSDDGLSLWRIRTELNDDKTKRIKKSRYAGHLSDDAWRIMKEYDHEAFISAVGERLRRHGGR
jgi:hypothetical protein